MSFRGMRLGIAALLAGGAITGALVFGGALVSAQTPSDTPVAGDTQTPQDTPPTVTPQTDQTPSDGSQTPNQAPSDSQNPDHHCDMNGNGQQDSSINGGTRFGGAGTRGANRF